jgi:hypothetical protein
MVSLDDKLRVPKPIDIDERRELIFLMFGLGEILKEVLYDIWNQGSL